MRYLIDTHCDTASEALDRGVGFYKNGLHVDLDKLKSIGYTQVFAAYIAPKYRHEAYRRACDIIDKVEREEALSGGGFVICRSLSDYLKNDGRVRAVLSLEGGEAFEDISCVEKLYRRGVRLAALTWNHKNRIAAGVAEEDKNAGLTDYGREIIGEMNRLGMLVDVSHLNEKSFWDVIEADKGIPVATHSNSRAVCLSARNLTDEQFSEIKKRAGFVGLNFYPGFLSDSGTAGICDIVRHIEHFLSLGGEDSIGIGADFDGVEALPDGICGVHEVYRLFDELLRLGYSESVVNKISYTNMERILKEIL